MGSDSNGTYLRENPAKPSFRPKRSGEFAYLKEAKRHSEPTVDAVAKALARFEVDTKHPDFKKFHSEQAIAFKKRLV